MYRCIAIFLMTTGALAAFHGTTAPATRPAPPASTAPADVASYLEFASAVSLVEVTEIKTHDSRPVDGSLETVATFNTLKKSGDAPGKVSITLEPGGRIPSAEPFIPHGPLYPVPLKAGERYWIVFDASRDYTRYPQGVVAWWPESAAPTRTLEEAIATDRFAWHPRYDAASGRFIGYRINEEKHQWKDRVWERTFDGPRTGKLDLWELYTKAGTKPEELVAATWSTRLALENPFNLPPGDYSLHVELDLETGKTVRSIVTRPWPDFLSVDQQMNYETGKISRETREEFLRTGCRARGASRDEWSHVTVTTFDAQGKKTTTEEFRREGSDLLPLRVP